MNNDIIEGELLAESIFGATTRRGLVRLSHGISWDVVITPTEALSFALTVLEVADAAESDEFLWKFTEQKLGIDDDAMKAQLLRKFRAARAEFAACDRGDDE